MSASVVASSAEVRVARSRRKQALMILGSLAFVAVSVLLLVFVAPRERDPVISLISWVGITFFGACFLAGLRGFFKGGPGLVVRDDGFIDDSSVIAVGFVPWSDVAELRIATIQSQRLLVIRVKDPKAYAARGNWLVRMIHRANVRLTGSPINLASNALRLSFEELVALMQERFDKAR